ncbi:MULTISPECIES: hypothetical protein [Flavobacterium]|uniref:Uncharacterized protein n=2 Tax=Flavobacterium TaxID=237 RepID=A0A6V6Z8D2_9FLAO|nr:MULTISPECIES: hypothetical protein [Flavobacterium]CAD0008073.1 hypothetical protein FLACHUCJ7_03620 [Flavobacterium chungangense]CAD0009278.1 hypothetical protein FLAT13_04819 [Flavobacterium salmonis]
MIRIEFEEPILEVCDCCNNETIKLTRFVYKNEDAFAIYYLRFTKSHDDQFAIGIISIGDWGTDDEPKNRFSFPFRIWIGDNDEYQIGLMDKEESPWNHKILGYILDRKEALDHPWIKEVFHITDHIVMEDKELIEYFD